MIPPTYTAYPCQLVTTQSPSVVVYSDADFVRRNAHLYSSRPARRPPPRGKRKGK